VIKVSDEGGGIRRSDMPKIWSYLFTTAQSKDLDNFVINEDTADFNRSTPLAGLGYGLPISRNYARHLGGDLAIMSMEGYGTDSFVYLARI
jgi:pyruvate dehydrogenase kinase 2/3/4